MGAVFLCQPALLELNELEIIDDSALDRLFQATGNKAPNRCLAILRGVQKMFQPEFNRRIPFIQPRCPEIEVKKVRGSPRFCLAGQLLGMAEPQVNQRSVDIDSE